MDYGQVAYPALAAPVLTEAPAPEAVLVQWLPTIAEVVGDVDVPRPEVLRPEPAIFVQWLPSIGAVLEVEEPVAPIAEARPELAELFVQWLFRPAEVVRDEPPPAEAPPLLLAHELIELPLQWQGVMAPAPPLEEPPQPEAAYLPTMELVELPLQWWSPTPAPPEETAEVPPPFEVHPPFLRRIVRTFARWRGFRRVRRR